MALIALAALQAVPRDITAASLVDGAGPFARFRFVILPYLAGPLMVALVLRTIEAFKVFDIIWVMTRGGPANSTRTLSILVYQEAFSFQRAGSGASLGTYRHAPGDRCLPPPTPPWCARPQGVPPDGTQEPTVFTVFIYLCALLLAAIILAPILWLFIMSISPAADLAAKPLRVVAAVGWISRVTAYCCRRIENSAGAAFTSSLRNSIEVAGMATIASHRARHSGRLGCVAHAFGRLVADDGDRHLYAAACRACRAALYGPVRISAC